MECISFWPEWNGNLVSPERKCPFHSGQSHTLNQYASRPNSGAGVGHSWFRGGYDLFYRVSLKTVATFVSWIFQLPRCLEIPSCTFFNSSFCVAFENINFFEFKVAFEMTKGKPHHPISFQQKLDLLTTCWSAYLLKKKNPSGIILLKRDVKRNFWRDMIYELGPWLAQAVRENSSHTFVWLLEPIRGLAHRFCPSRNFAWHLSFGWSQSSLPISLSV